MAKTKIKLVWSENKFGLGDDHNRFQLIRNHHINGKFSWTLREYVTGKWKMFPRLDSAKAAAQRIFDGREVI